MKTKNFGLFIVGLCLVMFASCDQSVMTIEVSNPWNILHDQTTVEIAWSDVVAQLPGVQPGNLVVVNTATGKETTHQVVFHDQPTPQLLIFQVTLAPNETVRLQVRKGVPKQEPVYRTFGRFVPERKDDYAWENDRIAFRLFGPALAPENPSNGVDLWLKKTENLIVDKFYDDDLNNNKSYHVDHGEGLDCYRVGPALGAGAISPFVDSTLWIGIHFTRHQTFDNGPLRTTFRLNYDNNLRVGEEMFSKEITVSIDAGSQMNKTIVSFDGNFTDIEVAAGIFLHADPGNKKADVDLGFTAFGEIATSDAGVPAGRNYIATIIPDGKMSRSIEQQSHLLAIAPYKKGEHFTYYFGGGWNQWGFDTDEKWFEYVANFAQRLKMPLTVTIVD